MSLSWMEDECSVIGQIFLRCVNFCDSFAIMRMGSLPLFYLFVLASFLVVRNKNNSKRPRLPPGPTQWPIVGSLPTMLLNKPHFRWVLRVAEGRDITCIRLGPALTIVVNSPALAREFLKKHDASFASRPLTMATEYSGRGFLSAVVAPWGDQWKKMRRVIASEVTSPARLKQHEALRHEEADHLVRCVHSLCDKAIDVRQITRHYAGNVIRRIIFGRRCFGEEKPPGLPGKEEVEHVDAAFAVLSLIYAFCPSDFVPCLRLLDLNGHERIARGAMEVINKYHDPVIEERVKRWRSGDNPSLKVQEDILDVLISLEDGDGSWLLTTEEIKAQSAELIFATVDNPSNTAEWALAHMMDQPETMRKAVEELDRVVGKDRLVGESDFPQLGYVKACAREALRLHPIAPFNLPHVAVRDEEVAGYFIPKGSQVLLSRVGLGRNPTVWDDPMRFVPERHLGAGSASVELAEPELRFISFTTGRRGCVGHALGSMMTYMLLARLIQAFEWRLAPGETCIDLSEEEKSLFMARPPRVFAAPRLPGLPRLFE